MWEVFKIKPIKYVPNSLSIIRMVLSVALLFFATKPWIFLAIYFASGITDFFDGKIARRYRVESSIGSKLDTWADAMLFVAAIVSVAFLAKLKIDIIKCLIPFGICTYHKLVNVMITKIRFNTWNMLHTILSKNIGGAAYLSVPAFVLLGEINFYVILTMSTFACVVYIEETVTLLKLEEFDVNHKGYIALAVKRKLSRAKAS